MVGQRVKELWFWNLDLLWLLEDDDDYGDDDDDDEDKDSDNKTNINSNCGGLLLINYVSRTFST